MALNGKFTPPGDRSISHQVVLAAILTEGEVIVHGLCHCHALKSTLSVFKILGGEVKGGGNSLRLKGLKGQLAVSPEEVVDLNCGYSGTTIRLLSGILAGLPGRFILNGDAQLRRRSMERLADPLRQMGAHVETSDGHAPLHINGGGLHGIEYINNDASAQIKSAVMLATMSASGASKIIEPLGTRSHTEKLLNLLGAKIVTTGQQIEIHPSSLTFPKEMFIPGDPSAASFFLIGAAMMPGSSVTAGSMMLSTERIGFLKILDRMGASVSISLEQEKPEPGGSVTVDYAGPLRATEISREEIPSLIDEIPMLALAAAGAKGVTVFRQVRELRLKETDRLTAIKHQLGAIGVRVKVEADDLIIEGPTKVILPEKLNSGYDHRLAMMLHMAAVATGSDIQVIGDKSIDISYPGFMNELKLLAGLKKSE